MGKMKDVCIQIIEANGGIPPDMTVGDVARMKDLEIYEWREYERQQEKSRSIFGQSENSREISKIEQAQKKFSGNYGQAREEKRSEQ